MHSAVQHFDVADLEAYSLHHVSPSFEKRLNKHLLKCEECRHLRVELEAQIEYIRDRLWGGRPKQEPGSGEPPIPTWY